MSNRKSTIFSTPISIGALIVRLLLSIASIATRVSILRVLCGTLATLCCPAAQAFIPIYGGPAFDFFSGSGYRNPAQDFGVYEPAIAFTRGIIVNNNGTAAGYADKYVNNVNRRERALRWNFSAVTELGPVAVQEFTTRSYATAINNAGTVVGHGEKVTKEPNGDTNYYGWRAVRWSPSSATPVELDAINLGANYFSYAYAVNESGTTVGAQEGWLPDGTQYGTRAVRWDGSGTAATQLADLGTDENGLTVSRAVAVNNAGTAVGFANVYVEGISMGSRAVRWDSSGPGATLLNPLESPDNYNESGAIAINDSGTVLGYSDEFNSSNDASLRAVKWNPGSTTPIRLDDLGTDNQGRTGVVPIALNSSGTVVGRATRYVSGVGKGTRPVRWDGSGTAATELETLGTKSDGTASGAALDINNNGVAVGYSAQYVSGSFVANRAVAWKSDNVAIDLNTLIDPASGWTLTQAYAISDTGWISGVGQFTDLARHLPAYTRLFLLQVPELSPLPVSGDFDGNGVVDAADYVVWRNGLDTTYTMSDYDTWRTHFGQTEGSGSDATLDAAVPEPTSVMLLIVGALAGIWSAATGVRPPRPGQ